MNPNADALLSIGDLAARTDVSVRAIRHYDEHGLLSSSRGANGYRYFPESAVVQVRQIQRMIGSGFSLAEIRSFPDCMRLIEGARMCSTTARLHRQRLQTIERQLVELERRRARLLRTLARGAESSTE